MERIREASENKLNYIQSHQGRFESFLKEDEELIKKKLLSVEEKKRKIQEMKEKELRDKSEKEKQEEIKRQEYERLALEQMKNAQKIAEDLREKHETNLQMKKMKAQGKKSSKTRKKGKKNSDFDEKDDYNNEIQNEINESALMDEGSIEKLDSLADDREGEDDSPVSKDQLDFLEEKIEKEHKEIKKNRKHLKQKAREESDREENIF